METDDMKTTYEVEKSSELIEKTTERKGDDDVFQYEETIIVQKIE